MQGGTERARKLIRRPARTVNPDTTPPHNLFATNFKCHWPGQAQPEGRHHGWPLPSINQLFATDRLSLSLNRPSEVDT